MIPRLSSLLVLVSLTLVGWSPLGAQPAADDNPLQLTLPLAWYAVPGVPMSLYFDNVVLTEHPEDYTFQVACDIGRSEPRRWTVTPTEADVGEHSLRVAVRQNDRLLGEARMRLIVAPSQAGAGKSLRLLMVGDSLTHATLYANELARLLSQPGNPNWKMLGTHRPAQAAEGVAHEGYGGWTWERFNKHYDPQTAPDARIPNSPFVFLVDGRPQLDVSRYIQERAGGQAPDVATFLLGINDCFSANPDDPVAIDARIDQVFQEAETLLTAFRRAAPQAALAVCLTTPPNARESGFEANYKGRYHRWGWKRIQHRLVQRQLKQFAGREREGVFVVPTQLNLDPVDGYPENNGVHPNAEGYRQIAASLYAWLKWRAAQPAEAADGNP